MKHDVQTGPDVRFALRTGVEKLARAVKVTMGPRGRNVVFGRAHGAPTITRDGVTVAREIELADPIETRLALQNAASISNLLLMTEGVVGEVNEVEPDVSGVSG